MALTVWYIPGWMRTQTPQEGVLEALGAAYPGAKIEFKSWGGDTAIWPLAVESADKESWRFAFEAAMMREDERQDLVLVGHSLGGRITARVLARLSEHGLRVKEATLMAAAIPHTDPDLRKMGDGAKECVQALCNPDDITLRYVYAIVGGEAGAAFGANGTVEPLANVREIVLPSNITARVAIDQVWAKSQALKDLANHHALFYIEYLGFLRAGEAPNDEIMIPQDLPLVEHRVVDAGIWWNTLEEANGWKLEQNIVTRHCRIISPDKRCLSWGGEKAIREAFDKTRRQIVR